MAAIILSGCGTKTEKRVNDSPTGTVSETPGNSNGNGNGNSDNSSNGGTNQPGGAEVIKYKADEIGQALLDGDYEGVYYQTTKDFHSQMSLEEFTQAGPEILKGVESWTKESELDLNDSYYITWMNQDRSKGLKVGADKNHVIGYLQVVPVEQFPSTDSVKTKHEYGLPFKGEWFVFWGGENVLANYHYEVEMQRYAYDLIQVKDGYSYSGDKTKNESYYAFGQEIIAPRAGIVVRVVSNIKDNEPVGKMNPEQPEGNVVVIDHGDGEYSFLAHMKKDSVVVKVGDKVEKGDLLGLCGNSGNTSEAHIHYQVSDGTDLFTGKSINIKWENGLNPHQGDIIK